MRKKVQTNKAFATNENAAGLGCIHSNGVINRLLEKYKPSKGLKILHGNNSAEQERAA